MSSSESDSEIEDETSIFEDLVTLGAMTPYLFEPKIAQQDPVCVPTFAGRSQQDCKDW